MKSINNKKKTESRMYQRNDEVTRKQAAGSPFNCKKVITNNYLNVQRTESCGTITLYTQVKKQTKTSNSNPHYNIIWRCFVYY